MIATYQKHSNRSMHARTGFSLVELMVVVSIIAVLVGLLLVALAKVRTTAAVTQTKNTMREFSAACDQFFQVHGRYPGVIPESVLAGLPNSPISSTENAMLELMGGFRVLRPGDVAGSPAENDYSAYSGSVITFGASGWRLKVDLSKIGEGPVIDGNADGPFFTPGESSFAIASGQVVIGLNAFELPDVIDAWGQPILYLRQLRDRGPLISADANDRPQFLYAGLNVYLDSTATSKGTGLGALGQDQVYDSTNNPAGSILTRTLPDYLSNFAYLLRHPALGDTNVANVMNTSTSRGAYVLISAGPDGIFFSAQDGPGARGDEVTNLAPPAIEPVRAVEEFDDIRIFGGG